MLALIEAKTLLRAVIADKTDSSSPAVDPNELKAEELENAVHHKHHNLGRTFIYPAGLSYCRLEGASTICHAIEKLAPLKNTLYIRFFFCLNVMFQSILKLNVLLKIQKKKIKYFISY